MPSFTQRMLHLLTASLDTTHMGVLMLQQGICARDRFQFGIEQARHFRARVTPAPARLQRNAMLFY